MNEIKILIVEDNYEKVRVFSEAIKEDESCHLEYCNNTKEALSKLKHNRYDILIVDMILPKCLGDHSENNAGLELIERLYIDTRIYQPNHVFAVTSHSDAFNTHSKKLNTLGVPFLLADGEFIEARNLLLNKIKYCSNQNTSNINTGELEEAAELASPEKITLKWLFQHVSVGHWLGALGVLVTVFCLGVQSTKLDVIKQLFNLEEKKEQESSVKNHKLESIKSPSTTVQLKENTNNTDSKD